jgi:hypothetical protein
MYLIRRFIRSLLLGDAAGQLIVSGYQTVNPGAPEKLIQTGMDAPVFSTKPSIKMQKPRVGWG